MLLVIFGLIFIYACYSYYKTYYYWDNKKVPHTKPVPILGHFLKFALRKHSFIDLINENYNRFPTKRYVGILQFNEPTLILRDVELIKRITIKDFDTFPQHRTFVPEEVDPLFVKNILSIPGKDRWLNLRTIMSPLFTSSKLKQMFEFMQDSCLNVTNYFDRKDEFFEIEMKETFSRFTTDVISSIAFGIKSDSFTNSKNELYVVGKSATCTTGLKSVRILLPMISTTIVKLLGLGILSKSENLFFRNLINETLKIRRENNIIRQDLIHLLLQAQENKLKKNSNGEESQKYNITDEDIAAQAVFFFLAGFESTSTALSFLTYELALNPDIQEKLRNEIDSIDTVDYNTIQEMKYMNLVLTELFRKWPPVSFTERKSVASYTIEPELPWEEPIHLDKGQICWIPIHQIHRDPKYFPDPERFDPERFNDENKDSIHPYTFYPFGMGPRKCLGYKFVQIEIKLLVYNILKKYEIVPVKRTPVPMVITKESLFPNAEGGFWLGLKRRVTL